MKKSLLSLLLILVSSLAYGAVGDSFIADGLRFTVTSEDPNEVEVTDYNYIYLHSSTNIVIPSEVSNRSTAYTVTSIGQQGFYFTSLTSVEIPATVREIGGYAFYSCDSLTAIDIPESVSAIGGLAFADCKVLESVVLPSSLIELSRGLLAWSPSLRSIKIPESVEVIGEQAFSQCTSLETVEFSESVKVIGNWAFESCISLESIHLPSSLESIGAVEIPASVTEIGTGAFLNCKFSEYQVNEDNQNFSTLDGILYNKNLSSLIDCPGGKSGDIELPGSVLEICDGAFCYCEGITSVTFNSPVTRIGNSSFGACTGLTSIDLPSTVTCIAGYAFFRCSSLVSISMPEELTEIGARAFGECPSLLSIRIPAPVVSIGDDAFTDCMALTEIKVDEANRIFSSSDGVLLNKDQSIVIKCPMGKPGSFAVPESVVLIRDYAFFKCSRLSSVVMSGSVREIGEWAFNSCTALETVVMPNSIEEIGYAAFMDCSSLVSVKIPSSVRTIKSHTFQNCSALSSVVIPVSVWLIDRYAFYNTSLSSVRIPATVEKIGSNPFGRCKKLMEIDVDEHNANYCSIDGVLFNKSCSDLVTYPGGRSGVYHIPDGVKTLAESAFDGCSIMEVRIPASVSIMRRSSFWNCDSLDAIYCMGTQAPSAIDGGSCFPESVFENATLYVPESALAGYSTRWPWLNFVNIRTFDPSGISDVDMDDDINAPMEVYTLSGMFVGDSLDSLTPGLYIVRQGVSSRKVVIGRR